jgi:predicted enzyme related to lactoylglutathione lyase
MTEGPTRRLGIVVDCHDVDRLAEFWARAIGYRRVDEPGGRYAVLRPLQGEGATFLLQRVGEQKAAKNRVHPDIYCSDMEAEATRIQGLGASRAGRFEEDGFKWIVMTDPEGNEFCVVEEVWAK